jgi:hypothetical protein
MERGMGPIGLRKSEWQELSAGLDRILADLDEARKAGVWDESLAAYYEFVRVLRSRIGPDGSEAYRRGTQPSGGRPQWVQRDLVERAKDLLSEN